MSSAGITRGLIEAGRTAHPLPANPGLPRGLPAASLKLVTGALAWRAESRSSAGITRGLIEADGAQGVGSLAAVGLPRGLPAASLKL